jgi:hypothetical protein
MNTASGFGLYLLGAFALVLACLLTPVLRNYLGAFVIFLFIGGVFFAWLNTIRQTNNMNRKGAAPPQPQQPKKPEAAPSQEKKDVEAEKKVPSAEAGQQSPPATPQQVSGS